MPFAYITDWGSLHSDVMGALVHSNNAVSVTAKSLENRFTIREYFNSTFGRDFDIIFVKYRPETSRL